MRTARPLAALALSAALTLSACGGDDTGTGTAGATASSTPTDSPSETSSESPGEHNDADVGFATEMIPHHAQALMMVAMARGRDLDPAVTRLLAQIRSAQKPEIATMRGWLRSWGEPVPSVAGMAWGDGRGHGTGHGMGHGMDDDDDAMDHGDMPGMMSQGDLDDLDRASGARFQDRWLSMMIDHHEGAIEMARTEQPEGSYPPALDLAASIEQSQTAEIATMRSLLRD